MSSTQLNRQQRKAMVRFTLLNRTQVLFEKAPYILIGHFHRFKNKSKGDISASFRETKDKVVAGASAIGQQAKQKFKEMYDKFSTKDKETPVVSTARQPYSTLPDNDDYDSLIGSDAPETPLGA